MKDEIQRIISGESPVEHGTIIQTILSYLDRSQAASPMAKEDKYFKKEEAKRIKHYAEEHELIVPSINLDNYISQGAEQKVYLKDGSTVIKLNDAIYYTSWVDYLHNLLLNNFFFPDTAYQLLGFFETEETLFAVVSQPFVKATEKTDLELVKEFMSNNGFLNVRNHDYQNTELGIILEDLHDENVLTQNGVLYFIDTVFYII